MNGPEILFFIFALMTCGGAIAVVVSQNVVRMAFWLMISLGSVAGLFFLLRADFVAAAQLMIYVGGTVVLLVFGVMLTASGRFVKIQTSPAEGFLGAGIVPGCFVSGRPDFGLECSLLRWGQTLWGPLLRFDFPHRTGDHGLSLAVEPAERIFG